MGKCKEKAQAILDNMREELEFMFPGRRNDDTVNLLIVCKVLGLDYEEVAEELVEYKDWSAFASKAAVVEEYLDHWFSEGDEAGMGYMLPGYRYLEL